MDASGIGRAVDSTSRQQIGPSAKQTGAVRKLSSQTKSDSKSAEGTGGGWRRLEITVRRLEYHKDSTLTMGEKGTVSTQGGGRKVPEKRGQIQLPSNSPKRSHHEWAAHSPVKD